MHYTAGREELRRRRRARLRAGAARPRSSRWRACVDELGIDCDWRRKPSFIYSVDESEREPDRAGARGRARRAGLPASLVTEAPELPFPIVAAVRYDNQAEFHPRKYLLALAREIPGDGCDDLRALARRLGRATATRRA